MKKTTGIALIFLTWAAGLADNTCARESPGIFAPFIDHVNAMMTNYIELKDALVNGNGAQAGREASEFRMYLKEISATSLDAKAEKRWSKRQIKIIGLLERILGVQDPDTQRNAFALLSEEMEALLKEYGPVGQTFYKQCCSKALDGEGAGWLNEKKEILNPYGGALHCGEVVEVIEGRN